MSRPKARFICTKPHGLGTGTTVWLQKHGVSVRPSLSTKKIQEITAVFELFDEDDSGAIVVEEAHTALKLLGLRATKSQVAKLVEKYDVNDAVSCVNGLPNAWLKANKPPRHSQPLTSATCRR